MRLAVCLFLLAAVVVLQASAKHDDDDDWKDFKVKRGKKFKNDVDEDKRLILTKHSRMKTAIHFISFLLFKIQNVQEEQEGD